MKKRSHVWQYFDAEEPHFNGVQFRGVHWDQIVFTLIQLVAGG